jgi:hypothetical protein
VKESPLAGDDDEEYTQEPVIVHQTQSEQTRNRLTSRNGSAWFADVSRHPYMLLQSWVNALRRFTQDADEVRTQFRHHNLPINIIIGIREGGYSSASRDERSYQAGGVHQE